MTARRVPLVRVALAVIERRGWYLISRRRSTDSLGGFWEFPGGRRRVGESWEACVRREAREELGLTVRPTARLASVRFSYADRRVELEPFRCEIVAGRPRPLGCERVKWVPARHLRRYRFPPANRGLVAWLLRCRGKRGIIIAGTTHRREPR